MLNGSLSNDEENEVAGMHELNDVEIYRVVTFRMDAKKNMEKFTNAQIKETEMVENEIIRCLSREHIFTQTNQIVYIHRETEQENGLEFRKKLEKLQQTIQELLVNRGVQQLSNHNKYSPQLHPLCFSLFLFYHKLTINHQFFDIFSFPPL